MIADDHSIVRRGLRDVLAADRGFDVVAEAGNLDAARRYVRGHRPDVLVLDLKMPGGSSLKAIPEIRDECPETQIVVLTMHNEPAHARQALSAGALGYAVKEAADEELVEAVRRAAVGETFLNPGLGARIAAEAPTMRSPRSSIYPFAQWRCIARRSSKAPAQHAVGARPLRTQPMSRRARLNWSDSGESRSAGRYLAAARRRVSPWPPRDPRPARPAPTPR